MKRLMPLFLFLAACPFVSGEKTADFYCKIPPAPSEEAPYYCGVCGSTHGCTATVEFFDSDFESQSAEYRAAHDRAFELTYCNCESLSRKLYEINSEVSFCDYFTRYNIAYDKVTLTTATPYDTFIITYNVDEIRRDWRDRFESTLVND